MPCFVVCLCVRVGRGGMGVCVLGGGGGGGGARGSFINRKRF